MTTNVNVLITSVSRKVWLVDTFKNALNQMGIEGNVISVDMDTLSAGLYVSDAYYITPPSSDQSFIPKILQICKKENVRLLIPTRNGELLLFAKNKERFRENGVEILVSDPDVIKICNDKYRFYQFLVQKGIPTPKTFLPSQVIYTTMEYPLIVKPRYGSGSKNTFKVKNQGELKFFLNYVPEPVVQEFIKGKEYTVDVLSDFDGKVVTVVPRERIETFGGESFKGKTVKDYGIIKHAKKLAEELGSIGHITIQCVVNEEAINFIEVNPRFGGGAALGIAAGANTPLLILKLILGEKIKPMIGEFTEDLIMLRYTKDIFLDGKTSNRDNVKKAVLFDLDDTLYDEMQFVKGGFKAVSIYVSKKYGINQSTFYETLLDVLEKEGRGHTFDIALQKLGLYEKELIPKLVQVYRKHKPKLSLHPDASVVLSKLKKSHKLGLITDGDEQVQRRKVQALGIKVFFDVLIFTNHYGVGKQKPNSFPYQRAIKMLKVKPVEAVYVGDDPYKDFIGAKKVGIRTIRVLRGKYKDVRLSQTFEADHEVNDLEEIFSFIF